MRRSFTATSLSRFSLVGRDPSVINIDNDRAAHWLSTGAQPTERVEKLLKISGAWEQAGRTQ